MFELPSEYLWVRLTHSHCTFKQCRRRLALSVNAHSCNLTRRPSPHESLVWVLSPNLSTRRAALLPPSGSPNVRSTLRDRENGEVLLTASRVASWWNVVEIGESPLGTEPTPSWSYFKATHGVMTSSSVRVLAGTGSLGDVAPPQSPRWRPIEILKNFCSGPTRGLVARSRLSAGSSHLIFPNSLRSHERARRSLGSASRRVATQTAC